MARKLLAAVCLLLAALTLFGCMEPLEEVPSGVVEATAPPRQSDDAAAADPTPTETPETSPEGIPLTQEEIDALLNGPAWEGVYQNGETTLVIRDRQGDMAVLILQSGENSFSCYVQVSSGQVTYTGESCAMTLTFGADTDTLHLALEGIFPVEALSPAGAYTRTGEDPAGYNAELGADALPPSLSDTVLNGRLVSVYLDPAGQFSALLPSIFSKAPADSQPEGGVYLVTMDDMAYARISVAATDLADGAAAAEDAAGTWPDAAISQEGGFVRVERSFEDEAGIGWSEVRLLCVNSGSLVTLEYAWQTEAGAGYATGAELLVISNN